VAPLVISVLAAPNPEGQRGDVWFLAGAFQSGAYVRSCRIPSNKASSFPSIMTPGSARKPLVRHPTLWVWYWPWPSTQYFGAEATLPVRSGKAAQVS